MKRHKFEAIAVIILWIVLLLALSVFVSLATECIHIDAWMVTCLAIGFGLISLIIVITYFDD